LNLFLKDTTMKTTGILFNELEQLIDMSLTRKAFLRVTSGHWIPAIDVYETPDSILVLMELAGVRKNDISVTFQDGFLTVSGERRNLCCDKPVGLHHMEIDTGRFQRKVKINAPVAGDGIEAVCRHGILRVTLPKEGLHE
jgi:HSP20 family protein